jgi:hypothetical protein
MKISGWRRIEKKDLPACFELHPAAFGDGYASREDILQSWNSLLDSPAFDGVVVEANQSAAHNKIVGFGAGVFVDSAFIEHELRAPQPYLTGRILASFSSNSGVVLPLRKMSINNSDAGLDMVILASIWAPSLNAEEARSVQVQLETSFLKLFTGFKLRRLLAELTNNGLLEYVQKTPLWRTIKQFPKSSNTGSSGSEVARTLVMLDRDIALSTAMSVAVPLFQVTKPVLGLHLVEQELLVAALKGATDTELAEDLRLTREGVKRRWKVLFDRLGEAKPELFQSMIPQNGKRGPQRRHRILAFLRDHPEELRPLKF